MSLCILLYLQISIIIELRSKTTQPLDVRESHRVPIQWKGYSLTLGVLLILARKTMLQLFYLGLLYWSIPRQLTLAPKERQIRFQTDEINNLWVYPWFLIFRSIPFHPIRPITIRLIRFGEIASCEMKLGEMGDTYLVILEHYRRSIPSFVSNLYSYAQSVRVTMETSVVELTLGYRLTWHTTARDAVWCHGSDSWLLFAAIPRRVSRTTVVGLHVNSFTSQRIIDKHVAMTSMRCLHEATVIIHS